MCNVNFVSLIQLMPSRKVPHPNQFLIIFISITPVIVNLSSHLEAIFLVNTTEILETTNNNTSDNTSSLSILPYTYKFFNPLSYTKEIFFSNTPSNSLEPIPTYLCEVTTLECCNNTRTNSML